MTCINSKCIQNTYSAINNPKPTTKLDYITAKRNYINSKTQSFDDISDAGLIFGLLLYFSDFCKVCNTGIKKSLSGVEKMGIGALGIAGISLIAKWIYSFSLSKDFDKKYDNENK